MTIVADHLTHRGIRFELIPHDRVATALDEAHALHVAADTVLKGVVLDLSTGHGLVVVPASRRVDIDLVRDALGDETARLAGEDEIARDFPEFELGAFPPVPSLVHVPVVIDREVFGNHRVTFAAGSQRESIRSAPEDLLGSATVVIAPVSHRIDE